MNDRSRKFLEDILTAIRHIETFCSDTPDINSYANDTKTKSAVERQPAIIGEAIIKIRKDHNNLQLTSAEKISAFRNRIVHSYDSIDDSIVWAVIKLHLPQLKTEVTSLLSN